MNCINCGDLIGNERDSDDKFCTDQCKVEYELEHNRKWKISSLDILLIANDWSQDVKNAASSVAFTF